MIACSNIQHIGIPTRKYEESLAFYRQLGFTEKMVTQQPNGLPVAFYELGNMVMEVYESADAIERAGAIDHITIDCSDIEQAYSFAVNENMTIVSEGIEALPYWENGIRFFKVEGPNKETIEICQIL